ncbi:MAG: GIY-YIG nuclease family protein [Saprospiraceae bacterium]|nr:GIY-YIG nuclease family protein [Saprospiraceae bacterium]
MNTHFFVYILYSKSADIHYIGHTSNLDDRVLRHNKGLENFTSKFRPWTLVFALKKDSKVQAFALELKLKNLSTLRLLSFIQKYSSDNIL